MNRFFGKLAKAAMIAAVLCLVAGGALATNLVERPFRDRAEVTEVSVGECDPGVPGILPPGLWEGTQIATHGGRGEVSVCIVVTGFVTPVLLTVEGRGVTTAANGDETYLSVSGALDVSSDPCVSLLTVIVVGGTGRFEGASGLIQTTGIQPWSAPGICGPEVSSKSRGTITY